MVSVSESIESGDIRFSFGSQSAFERQFHVKDAATRIEALSAVANEIIGDQFIEIGGRPLVLDNIHCKPISDDSLGRYTAVASWISPERAQNRGNNDDQSGYPLEIPVRNGLNDPNTWVDGTQVDVSSEEEIQYWSQPGSYSFFGTTEHAVDLYGAINFDGENVKGVGRLVPKPTWSEEFDRYDWFHPAKLVELADYVGKINETTYRTFRSQTLLITNISGSFKNKKEFRYRVTYAYSPRKVDIKFGEGTESYTVPEKNGWQYMWTRYEKTVIGDLNLIVPRPVATYVHDVYETAEFNLLDEL